MVKYVSVCTLVITKKVVTKKYVMKKYVYLCSVNNY